MPIFIFSIISQWQLYVTIATRVLNQLGQKQFNSFLLPIDAICEIWYESALWLQRRCRLKMLSTDAWLYYKLTFGSGELKMLKIAYGTHGCLSFTGLQVNCITYSI